MPTSPLLWHFCSCLHCCVQTCMCVYTYTHVYVGTYISQHFQKDGFFRLTNILRCIKHSKIRKTFFIKKIYAKTNGPWWKLFVISKFIIPCIRWAVWVEVCFWSKEAFLILMLVQTRSVFLKESQESLKILVPNTHHSIHSFPRRLTRSFRSGLVQDFEPR
jgi:hypothetical protein